MRKNFRSIAGLAATAAVMMTAAGCDDFLQVRNPTVVDAATIDPSADLPTFSLSARQNYVVAQGWLAMYGGWFTHEIWVGDSFPTRNEFALRTIDFVTNGSLATDVWNPTALAIATNNRVMGLAQAANAADGNINYARSAMFAGWSIIRMADHFCEGAISDGTAPGQRMSTQQMYEAAIQRFQEAIRVGGGITGAEATSIVNAARVGVGRAQLQLGRNAEAAASVQAVPANFDFALPHLDDPNFRTRLGNRLWQFTFERESIVTPPVYREMNDPRITFQNMNRFAQDGILQFVRQNKYTAWATPTRLTSGLEARYIAAEAQLKAGNPAAALTLIAERRTAGGQGAFAGAGDAAILAELMAQSSRDFWLEGRRMADFRRNPTAVPNLPAAGAAYYKPGQGNIGTQTCFPVPRVEIDNNPNFQ